MHVTTVPTAKTPREPLVIWHTSGTQNFAFGGLLLLQLVVLVLPEFIVHRLASAGMLAGVLAFIALPLLLFGRRFFGGLHVAITPHPTLARYLFLQVLRVLFCVDTLLPEHTLIALAHAAALALFPLGR